MEKYYELIIRQSSHGYWSTRGQCIIWILEYLQRLIFPGNIIDHDTRPSYWFYKAFRCYRVHHLPDTLRDVFSSGSQ